MCTKELFANSYSMYAFIRALNNAIEMDIKKVVEKEVNFPGFKILWILYFDSNLNLKQLAYYSQTNISNSYRQLVKLREKGFILMEESADLRTKKLRLTEKGKSLIESFLETNTTQSPLKLVQLMKKIPMDDFMKFMQPTTFILQELLGKDYQQFVEESASTIKEETN